MKTIKTIDGSEIWMPTPEEQRQIDQRVRVERARAFREAFSFVGQQLSKGGAALIEFASPANADAKKC